MSELILEKIYNFKNIDAIVEEGAEKICAQCNEVEKDFALLIIWGVVVKLEKEFLISKNKNK